MSDMNKRAGSNDCDDCGEGGERGERGEKGEKGKHGKRGPRGHDGHDGRDGRDGDPGATGPTGPSSIGGRGPTGPVGATGSTGRTGLGSTGPTGPCCTGPTGPAGGGGTGSSGIAPIIAAAFVDGVENSSTEGFLTNHGFSSYVRSGEGQYQLALSSPPADPDTNCLVHVTDASGSIVTVGAQVNGSGTVFVFIQSPLLIAGYDSRFYITVYDNT